MGKKKVVKVSGEKMHAISEGSYSWVDKMDKVGRKGIKGLSIWGVINCQLCNSGNKERVSSRGK